MKKMRVLLAVFFVLLMANGLCQANPVPRYQYYSHIIIISPRTFSAYSTTQLFFNADTNCSPLTDVSFYYSLDNAENKPVENITILSQELISPVGSLSLYRTVLVGSSLLCNLSEGSHTITVYQISIWGGNYHSSSQFEVNTTSIAIPTPIDGSNYTFNQQLTVIVILSVAILAVAIVSMVFFRRRKEGNVGEVKISIP